MGWAADRRPDARLTGLDGMRAIAVLAVVGYHLGLESLPGGYLGVEVFFVISGFLITTLLLAEWRGTGTLRLGAFWIRRARRLIPALLAVTFAVLATAAVAFPDQLARLRTDALAGVLYLSNWQLLLADVSYFEEVGRPSALLHLWSLAIEGQFYLVWPVVLLAALVLRGPRLGAVLAVLGLGASIAVTAATAVPGGDPSRVYYGADARAAGLLCGALLAFTGIGARPFFEAPRQRAVRLGSGALACLAIAGLIAAFLLVPPDAPGIFAGGLLVIDGLTVTLIAAVLVHRTGVVARALELGPVRWVGTRSYGLYLWHWPVLVFTQPGWDLPLEEPAATVVRLSMVVALTELSYRFVEEPFRRGRRTQDPSQPSMAPRWTASMPSRRQARRFAFGLGAATVLAPLLVAVATAQPPAPSEELTAGAIDGLVTGATDAPDRGSPISVASATPAWAASPAPATPVPAPSLADDSPIFAVGESVLVGAAKPMAEAIGPMVVDARIGRQIADSIDVLRQRAEAGRLGRVVILLLGNNGPIRRQDAEQVMQIVRDVPVVIWINVRVPRSWEGHNNDLIASLPTRYANVRVVDWHAATAGRPDLLASDGVHLTTDGYEVLASLVRDALAD